MKKIIVSWILAGLLLGCNESEEIKVSTGVKSQDIIAQTENLDKSSYAGLEDVFLDTKNLYINEDNKLTLFIFAKNNCMYCDKLKDDIKKSDELQSILKEHFLPYYINTSYSKTHLLHRDNNQQDFKTHALMDAYVKSPMRPTPTLVFINSQGESIYELPGYLPKEPMLKLLEYMTKGKWQGKSQKQISIEINEEI